MASKKIDPYKPADYRQAVELAEIYSDHWSSGTYAEGPQFSDKERYEKLFDYLQTRKTEWWGVDLHRLEGLLGLDAWWRGTKAPSEQAASSGTQPQTGMSQATPERLDQIKQDTQSLRNEVKNLQQAFRAKEPPKRIMDPVIALLLVFCGVLAGFLTVALTKLALAKKR